MKMIEYKGLLAPQSYADASQAFKDIICNGCGTGGWKGKLVPETAYGLSFTRACNIHDWMYDKGRTLEDKEKADDAFHLNMRRLIRAGTPWLLIFLLPLRYARAFSYYKAVSIAGGDAFWDGKTKPSK